MKRNATKAPARKPGSHLSIGISYPLGATVTGAGANFSLFSRSATRVELLFFDREDDSRPSRIIDWTHALNGPTTIGTSSSQV